MPSRCWADSSANRRCDLLRQLRRTFSGPAFKDKRLDGASDNEDEDHPSDEQRNWS